MSTSSGTKVTKDPQATENPKFEGAGTITSDSLAGESLSSGGAFGAGSGVGASSQPSKSTTTNNTDISNATVLNSAPDAEARQASEGWSETAQLNAGRGLGSSAGNSSAGTAPNYVNTPANSTGGSDKPHGQNITEGGFASDAPNASFNSDIGGKNDPGRVALNDFERSNAQSGFDAAGERQTGISNDGQFDKLDETSA